MMPRSVDLPHPEGPLTATNSPRPTTRSTSARARVSTSAVSNTLVTPPRRTIGSSSPDVMRCSPSFEPDAIVRIPGPGVRQDQLVARVEPLQNLDAVDRGAP